MTKKREIISKLFLLFAMSLTAACGRQMQTRNSQSDQNLQESNAGVIGGARIEQSPEASQYENKVLYLAMNVREVNGNVEWKGHCTASAISSRVILTAAHCAEGQKAEGLKVVLTKNPATVPLNVNEWYSVTTFKVHEGYIGEGQIQNDLALILVDRDLPEETISKLADPSHVRLPIRLSVVGYGTSSESSDENVTAQKTSILNYVMKTVDHFDVNQKTFKINQNDHKGFCNGDSGGPGFVVDPETGDLAVIGVVSNVSMLIAEKNAVDPQGRFSLCIGDGNYMNVLNPELRNWILTNHNALMSVAK